MYTFNKYVERILDKYRIHLELVDTVPIGFDGVASRKPAPVFTSQVSADILLFAAYVDFTASDVLIRVQSRSPQYQWMTNNNNAPQDTPIGALAGITTQVMPVLPLISPFFLEANGQLQMQFTNSATAPVTGGSITWRGIKLVDPIDGGWQYGM